MKYRTYVFLCVLQIVMISSYMIQVSNEIDQFASNTAANSFITGSAIQL